VTSCAATERSAALVTRWRSTVAKTIAQTPASAPKAVEIIHWVTALRDAAALAVSELGIAPSATALTTTALRAALEAVVMHAALDDHYERHPQARPDLGDLAIAAAEIAANHPGASPDDVLLWTEARALPAA
jgi:hypothetical protein